VIAYHPMKIPHLFKKYRLPLRQPAGLNKPPDQISGGFGDTVVDFQAE
jgi:hypothetical protein